MTWREHLREGIRLRLGIIDIDLRLRTTEALRRGDRAFSNALEVELNELRERVARLESKE